MCFEATAVSHFFQGICLPILALPEWLCHVSQQQGATLIGAQEQFQPFLIASTTHLDPMSKPQQGASSSSHVPTIAILSSFAVTRHYAETN